MARAIWKGTISFGLVNIPIALYPATRREELSFRLLRKGDLSPVNYKRVAEKVERERAEAAKKKAEEDAKRDKAMADAAARLKAAQAAYEAELAKGKKK